MGKFADSHSSNVIEDDNSVTIAEPVTSERLKFMTQLSDWFWHLLNSRPLNIGVCTLGQPGITHVEATVQALVEIFHAFTTVDMESVEFATQLYAKFLLAEDVSVAFAAKQALVRALRPKARTTLGSFPTKFFTRFIFKILFTRSSVGASSFLPRRSPSTL